jgi:citrate synthase
MGTEEQSTNGGGVATATDSLTVTDNRTGRTYEIPIEDGTIRAPALRDIKVAEDDFGLMTYDPAFMNTASARTACSSTAAIPSSSSRSSRPTSRSRTC